MRKNESKHQGGRSKATSRGSGGSHDTIEQFLAEINSSQESILSLLREFHSREYSGFW